MKKILKKILKKTSVYKYIQQALNYELSKSIVSNYNLIDKNVKLINCELNGNIEVKANSLIFKTRMVAHNKISIGQYTVINGPATEIHSLVNSVNIGSFCSIAAGTEILDFNHNTKSITTSFIKHKIFTENHGTDAISKGSVSIGNDVWVGTKVTVLSGVTIGDGCVIAANSTVTTDIPPFSIASGTPAKVIKKRFSDEIIEKLLEIQWWDWNIEKIKRNKELFYGDLTMEKLKNIVE